MSEDLLSEGPDGVFVTLGPGGAEWVVRPSSRWVAAGEEDARGFVPADPASLSDPTGCGDVWGVTCFTSLLEDASLTQAIGRANRVAAACAESSGTKGLSRRLAHAALVDMEDEPRA